MLWSCEDDISPQRARPTHPATAPAAPSKPSEAAEPPASAIDGVQSVDAATLLERVHSQNARGLLVNVWASWCGSCREEIPMLLKLREGFVAEGIEVVFVSADEPKDLARAVELMRSWAAPLPALAVAGSMGAFKRAMNPRWRGAIPATFLFDTTPKLRHFWEGPVYEHEVAPILQGFLAGHAIDGDTRTAAPEP
jgi:thiol-disulfide isomerase/thioredoxin